MINDSLFSMIVLVGEIIVAIILIIAITVAINNITSKKKRIKIKKGHNISIKRKKTNNNADIKTIIIDDDGENTIYKKQKNHKEKIKKVSSNKNIAPLNIEPIENTDRIKLELIKSMLTPTQGKIVNALIKSGDEAFQTELLKLTRISKASLSKNLDILESREVIIKSNKGRSNFIKFHPSTYNDHVF